MSYPLENLIDRRNFLHGIASCCTLGSSASYARLLQAAVAEEAAVHTASRTHHEPRAKQLVIVFLTGGFSHIDTFNYRPELASKGGQAHELAGREVTLLASPFKFQSYGESGLMVSELFTQLGSLADDLCVIQSMQAEVVEHFQATLAMHSGSATIPMPSIGAWLSYGLGTLNPNLPAYTVLCEHLPYAGSQVWDSLFLPPIHQGVRILPGPEPIANLQNKTTSASVLDLERTMLQRLNELHAESRGNDLELQARTKANQTAAGMMQVAPNTFDISSESKSTLQMYGLEGEDRKSFAWQCLAARRLIEQGVRVVELIESGSQGNWDAHSNMDEHLPKARRVDQPLAALIKDLKQRGLLDETLVAICTEFGRSPWAENTLGRGHHGKAFCSLLAGGGIKGGISYGKTDPYGYSVIENPCTVHDYHATILHQMGIDHERLTYRYAGRDFRLTDVHGNVIEEILA